MAGRVSITLAPLTHEQKVALRPFAQLAVVSSAVFAGATIALQIAALAPYPGTNGDPVMLSLSFIAVFVLVGTLLKAAVVYFTAPWIERKFELDGEGRDVRLRGIFNRSIRNTAFWGGFLQAIYGFLFTSLVTVFAPTTLASARACVIISVALVEIVRQLLPHDLRTLLRLLVSIGVTLAGAYIVVFQHGSPFAGLTLFNLLLLIGLIGPGNFILALAEYAEYKGVHSTDTSAAVYTLARFVSYLLSICTATVLWGANHGGFDIFWSVCRMLVERWYFLIPISLFWGLTDLVRICSKTVVSATYMYVVGSLSVAIDAIVQTIAKLIDPVLYHQIPNGWTFPIICFIGGLVIAFGNLLFPHPKSSNKEVDPEAL